MMLTGAELKHPENAYAGNVDAGNSPHGLSRTRQPAAPALVQILPLEIRFPSARVSPMLDASSGCFDSALQVLLGAHGIAACDMAHWGMVLFLFATGRAVPQAGSVPNLIFMPLLPIIVAD